MKATSASASCQATKCKAEAAAGKVQAARVRTDAIRLMASKAPPSEIKRDLKALMESIMTSDVTTNLLRCSVSRCKSQMAQMYAAMCADGACAGIRVPGPDMTYETVLRFNAELIKKAQAKHVHTAFVKAAQPNK
jgi:hypothetical protein